MAKYRIGLVCCGGIANNHIQGCKSVLSDLGEVVAGCDPNAETLNSFCDQYDLSLRFTDVEFLIGSEEVDVIALLTPPAVRSEVIFPAIERGVFTCSSKSHLERRTRMPSHLYWLLNRPESPSPLITNWGS